MRILLPILLLCCGICVYPSLLAQDKKTDSLKQVVNTGKPNQQVDALNKLCRLLMYDKPAEAKIYVLRAMQIAEAEGYKLGLGDAYNTIGIVYDISGKYDSSIYYYEKAIPIFTGINDRKGLGSAKNNLGLIYWNKADYEKALQYFFDALKDFEAIHNENFIANALNNIGLVYFETGSFRQSLVYHFKAKPIYEKLNDQYFIGAVANNIANDYSNLKILDSAEMFYREAIRMHAKANDDYGLSIAYNGYAGLFAQKENLDSALYYFDSALKMKEAIDEKVGICSVLINMASIYEKQQRNTLALEFLNRAKLIAEENNFKKEKITIYKDLSEAYETSNLALAFSYYKKYSEVKDSVFNETSQRQVTELNTKYETSKKELALKEQGLEITKKNLYIAGISGLFVLLALLGFSYYKRSRLQQEKRLQAAIILEQDMATKAVIAAEENERRRIAADLHDGVGQMMSAAKMNFSSFENEVTFKDEQQKQAFDKAINLLDESCKEVRSVSHQMMPNALLKSGLTSAIREFIEKIDSRVLKINLYTEGLNERLESNVETVLYRVIQECVNNVIKHAGAGKLDISLIRDEDGISATIEDNGKGFDSTADSMQEGIGIRNIRSRIHFLKGTVDFDSQPGKGTLVAIHVPLA